MNKTITDLLEAAEKVDCGSFGLTASEMDAIRTKGNAQLFNAIGLAFQCGFVKGQRAMSKNTKEAKTA